VAYPDSALVIDERNDLPRLIEVSEVDRLYGDAIEAYRQALRIDPKHAKAWYNLGLAYNLSDNRTAALEAVKELRRLDPEEADKLFNS
jgi:tetratricopeptide (TPR) repeat protein